MYNVLRRVKTYDNLYYIGEFKKSAKNALFSTIKRNIISGDTVTVPVHNLRSLPRHLDNIVSDNEIINNIIEFFNPPDNTCKIIETLNLFNISSTNNENKILRLTYRCRN